MFGGCGEIEIHAGKEVQAVGEQSREIVMFAAERDFSTANAAFPKFRGCRGGWLYTVLNGKLHTQPFDGFVAVARLAALFRSRRFDVGGNMLYEHPRFDFVAVLAAGSAASLPAEFASGDQIVGGESRRMHVVKTNQEDDNTLDVEPAMD